MQQRRHATTATATTTIIIMIVPRGRPVSFAPSSTTSLKPCSMLSLMPWLTDAVSLPVFSRTDTVSLSVECGSRDRDDEGNDVRTGADDPHWNDRAVKKHNNRVAVVVLASDFENRINIPKAQFVTRGSGKILGE